MKNLPLPRLDRYDPLFSSFYFRRLIPRVALMLLLMVACQSITFAQGRKVSGKVTSEEGLPLAGVTVSVKGGTGGTATAADGTYTLTVPSRAVLVFTTIGYAPQEFSVGDRSTVDIRLSHVSKAMDEVVVVAYGTSKRKDLTGAVSSVTAAQIEKVPVTTLDQALQGRSAGVNVVSNDGSPGAGIQVQIRGVGSLGNNDPLYVVDGYPITGGLNTINPNDIASMEILKDASATAIYGNRASNGVVIITTKRGGKNGVQVSLDGYTSVQSKPKKYDVLNAADFATLATQLAPVDGYTPLPAWSNPSALHNADWQDAVYRTGLKQNYNIAIRGGSDKVQSAFSGGYYDQKGIVLGSFFKRINASLNLDYTPFSWLRSSSSFKYARGDNQVAFGTGGQGASAGVGYLTKLPPTVTGNSATDQIKDGKGNYGFYTPTNQQVRNWGSGPVYTIETQDQKNLTNYFLGNSSLEATLIPGLKVKTNLGINTNDFSGYYFTPTDDRALKQYGIQTVNAQNFYSQSANNTYEWLWENTIAYSKTFGDHSIDFVGGYSAQKNTFRQISGSGNNLPSDALRDLGSLPTLTTYVGNQTTYTLTSQFGRLNYKFLDRYLVTATVRRDGSSKFAPGHQYGVFPSGSVAWRAKEESFLKNVNWLSDLKIRGGYGQVGNQAGIGLFQYLGQYGSGGAAITSTNVGYPFDKIYQSGLVLTSLPNPNLKWETSDQTDIGMDASFLNGDLSLTVDYYNKKSRDFLLSIPVPAQTGFVTATRNVGSIDNKGIEIALNYRHTVHDFSYNIGVNLTTVSNKLLSLATNQTYINNLYSLGFSSTGVNNWVTYTRSNVGGPIGAFYGYKSDGVFQTQKEIDDLNASAAAQNGAGIQYQPSAKPGDHKYVDVNKDGKVTNDDQVNLGSPIPKFYGGLNLEASWKAFDINAFFYGTYGNKIFNYQEATLESFQSTTGSVGIQNISENYYHNAWTTSNHSQRYSRLTSNDVNQNTRPSDLYVENGSYLRLRNLQVGYTLPAGLTKRASITRLRVYISAQNLFTITKYSGLDPEIGQPAALDPITNQPTIHNVTAAGIDVGTYPSSRFYTLGLNVTF
ncbi:MAG TPA: TonB-dependent receptor [Puia sp.]|nr:TonB-dependent receptor [Puia sp.]